MGQYDYTIGLLGDRQIMPFTNDSRVATTRELVDLNKRAIDFPATRVMDEYELLNLDEDGLHILTHISIFWHPFRRCQVAMKISGDPFAHFGVLDLQDEWYDELPTLGDYLKAQDYYRTHPRGAQ